jgi:hypothetical protein
MVSKLKVDELQNSAGTPLLVNGYPRQPGQIIEVLASPCDGSPVTVGSGTYTVQSVTGVQTLSTTYQDLTGSTIAYTPPAGATRVIYEFCFAMNWLQDHAISHHRFYIDGVEVVSARFNRSARYPEDKITFEWPIAIGGVADPNTGRQATWVAQKTLKIQSRVYGTTNARNAHGTTYWDGVSSVVFVMPTIKITAIA